MANRTGPFSMFEQLLSKWATRKSPSDPNKLISPSEIAIKVKRFFKYYAMNRHKMTVLTPTYHADRYGTDDNRYDLRQFLYDTTWNHQFA